MSTTSDGRDVWLTIDAFDDIIEIRFPFDRATGETLKVRCSARWHPEKKCWWVPKVSRRLVVDVLDDLGYAVHVDGKHVKGTGQQRAPELERAVLVLFNSVSSSRKPRLARALAAAAHPDGDGPDRPAAADQLILLATRRLNAS